MYFVVFFIIIVIDELQSTIRVMMMILMKISYDYDYIDDEIFRLNIFSLFWLPFGQVCTQGIFSFVTHQY